MHNKNIIIENNSRYKERNKLQVEVFMKMKQIYKLFNSNYREKQHLLHKLLLRKHTEDNKYLSIDDIKNKFTKTLLSNLQNLNEADRTYNIHHHSILLQNGYEIKDLLTDSLDNIFYPRDLKKHSNAVKFKDYLDYKLHYNKQDEENLIQCLEDIKNGKNIIIIKNHTTYFDFGVLIIELERLYEQMMKGTGKSINNINDFFYIILGGALMTNKQGPTLAQGIANIIKTHPNTKNGIIPEIEKEQTAATVKFIRKVFDLQQEDNKGKYGKIFFFAPTGTKDTINRDIYNNSNNIYFGNDDTDSVSKSITLIEKMTQKNEKTSILLCGLNESEFKNPNNVNPKNDDRAQYSNIVLSTQLLDKYKFRELIKNKKVMETIAQNVKNINGDSIAKALTEKELEEEKKTIQKITQRSNFGK